jgi:carbon-monoxide dehydrogenase medium subunit
MKAPAFAYTRPGQLSEVLDLLVQHGDDARLLAGGQTLLATLNMRLSEPSLLIDLHEVQELHGISLEDRCLRIGAMVTHSEIESSPLVAQHAPLLSQAAPHIAHRAIRNQGTFGGSIAYADPAAEWPACLLALEGVIVVQGPGGERRIAASDFFTGLYSTALASDDIIVACDIQLAADTQRSAFAELARRQGDYAVVGLAATTRWNKNGFDQLRLAWLGVGSMPIRTRATEQVLQGQPFSEAILTRALQTLGTELHAQADLTHSAAAKLHLADVLLKRVLAELAAPVNLNA